MKKNLFVVAAVALMAFTACNKEEFNASVDAQAGTVEFVAGFDVDTKTALDDTKTKTLWAENDEISINGFVFKVSELIDGGTSAKFVNEEDLKDFGAPFTACYPANVTEIPAVQYAFADNFDPKAVVEKAYSDDYNLSFQNVASLLKFRVPAACETVTLTSDDVLAGADSKTVTINGPFAADQEYFAAVKPGTKAKFSVSLDGKFSRFAPSVTIEESSIVNMGTLPDLLFLVPNSNWKNADARFAVYFYNDKENKWVDMTDTNGDGIYEVEKPSDYHTAIFCRMNPSVAANIWDNKWNQTGDMKIANQSYCIIPFDVWDGSTLWSYTSIYEKNNYFHLAPNGNWFTQSDDKKDPWFAAYFYNSDTDNIWKKMDLFSTNPKYYRVAKDSKYQNIIFTRMDPAKTELSWGSKWNQSSDLKTSGGYFYEITGWNESGKWVSK